MTVSKTKMLKTILSLKTISDDEVNILMQAYKDLDREDVRTGFKLQRLQKDKNYAEEILNATIQDLEEKKQELEYANVLLQKQKRELKEQSQIIKQKSLELTQSLQKLEFSYNELEQFSYIASHDLKSPLRTIGNFAQLLRRRYKDRLDEDANEFLDFIVTGVAQMNNVIQHSLEYALVGKKEITFEETDLNKTLEMVCFNLQKEIQERDVELLMTPLPSICADKIGLIHLFQNLISNAIKFCPEDRTPIVKITTKLEGPFWIIKIKDNGIGISEEYRSKIFKPFKRIGLDNVPGAGIGLAICRKIVRQHYGDITYTSELRKGTTFILSLAANATQPKEV